MRRWKDIEERESPDLYAEWLTNHRSHDDLVADAERIFSARGPRLPRRLRRDLVEFLRERSDAHLARLVALNDDPRDDAPFMAWLREEAP